MSRAFVKEEGGQRWQPAAPVHELQVWRVGRENESSVYDTDDLLDALRWVASRPEALRDTEFVIKSRDGRALALAQA